MNRDHLLSSLYNQEHLGTMLESGFTNPVGQVTDPSQLLA